MLPQGGVLPLFLQGWRLHFIFLACILSVGLFFAGQFAYQEFFLEKPLREKLQAEQGVQGVRMGRTGDVEQVIVELGPVENLEKTYLNVNRVLHRFYRQGAVQLIIRDQRSPALEQAWEKIQFAIYEAAVRGNFTAMAKEVEREANERGVRLKLDMDRNYIYVALYQGFNYLYEIVPREPQGKSLSSGGEISGA